MEKLLELLNEYRTGKGERNLNDFEVSQTLDSLDYLRLFIGRLVNNDKIDQWKVYDYEKDSCWELTPREWIDDFPDDLELRDRVLMLLSISDTPIQDLISYLK